MAKVKTAGTFLNIILSFQSLIISVFFRGHADFAFEEFVEEGRIWEIEVVRNRRHLSVGITQQQFGFVDNRAIDPLRGIDTTHLLGHRGQIMRRNKQLLCIVLHGALLPAIFVH